MEKYTIHVHTDGDPNAGTKAREDLEKIASDSGYKLLILRKRYIHGRLKFLKQIYWLVADFLKFFVKIKRKSLLMIISPLPFNDINSKFVFYFFSFLKLTKKIKISIVLIDINKNRYINKVYNGELIILKCADYIIAHNEKMIDVLKGYGFKENRIISIEIFDYVAEYDFSLSPREKSNKVVFAANLEPVKAGFIYTLERLQGDVFFNIYGGNYQGEEKGRNFQYKGVYPIDEILSKLEGSFGLVWDGYSIDTCSGTIGEYLKINNPHKTSLYLAAGLPVIIWSKAALADFIVEKKLGFAVDSLEQIDKKINDLSDYEYREMINNVREEANKISNGLYFKKTLEEVERRRIINESIYTSRG